MDKSTTPNTPRHATPRQATPSHAMPRPLCTRVLGENNANLPKIVQVLVGVLAKGDALIKPDAAQQAALLLQQMQAALPPDVFAGFVAALKPKQQATLQGILGRAT
jgi:hypothetical protein